MARPALSIEIRKKDQQELRKLVKGGVQPVRVVLRALALLQLAEHASAPQIAKVIPLTAQAIRRLGHRYEQAGLVGALYEKTATGRGQGAGQQPETAHHRHGLQRSARGPSALDGEAGSGRSRKTQTGPASGERSHPDSAAPSRPQAVAGKKCGVSPN